MPKNKRMNLTPRGQGEDALYSPVTTATTPQGEKEPKASDLLCKPGIYITKVQLAWLKQEALTRWNKGGSDSISAIVREAIDRLREAEE